MKTDTFSINLKEISAGWCNFELDFGRFTLPYNASYIGDEPLSSLIEVAYGLQTGKYDIIDDSDEYEPTHEIIWLDEPGYLRLKFTIAPNSSDLTIQIAQNFEDIDFNADNETKKWDISMPKQLFVDAVIDATLKALKKYGICGFHRNWCTDAYTFPLHAILQLLADPKLNEVENGDSLKSDIFEELELLQTALKRV